MARCQFGPSIIGLRGTIAGATFSQNTSGPYVKALPHPTIRKTTPQILARSRLNDASYHWSILSAPMKAAWNAFAAAPNENDYDPWGNLIYFNGYIWHARCNLRRTFTSQPWQTVPPTGPTLTMPSGLSATIRPPSIGISTVSWSSPSIPAGNFAIIELALSDCPSVIAPRTHYLVIAAAEDPGTGPVDVSLGLSLRFGEFPPGWKAFIRLWHQAALANRSPAAYTSTIVLDT